MDKAFMCRLRQATFARTLTSPTFEARQGERPLPWTPEPSCCGQLTYLALHLHLATLLNVAQGLGSARTRWPASAEGCLRFAWVWQRRACPWSLPGHWWRPCCEPDDWRIIFQADVWRSRIWMQISSSSTKSRFLDDACGL